MSDAIAQRSQGPNWAILTPLVYAPLLPLIRIATRNNVKLRVPLFGGTIAMAFVHGIYVMSSTGINGRSDGSKKRRTF